MNEPSELPKSKQNNIWAGRIKLTGVLIVINAVILLITAFLVFPTQAHRDTMQRLSEISQSSSRFEGGKIVNTDEYTSLANSPEAQYVTIASGVASLISFVLSIVIVGLSYNYARKHRLTNAGNAVGIILLINLAASLVAWALVKTPVAAISGVPVGSAQTLLFEFVIVTVFSLITFSLAAYIFQRIYNNKHSMVV